MLYCFSVQKPPDISEQAVLNPNQEYSILVNSSVGDFALRCFDVLGFGWEGGGIWPLHNSCFSDFR